MTFIHKVQQLRDAQSPYLSGKKLVSTPGSFPNFPSFCCFLDSSLCRSATDIKKRVRKMLNNAACHTEQLHVFFLCKDLWQPTHRCNFPNFAVQVCLIKAHPRRIVSLSATHMMYSLQTWKYGH